MKWLLVTLSILFTGYYNPIFSQKFTNYFEENNLQPEAGKEGYFFTIEKNGNGEKAQPGDYVKIHYKGMLLDGTVFDESSKDDPFVFRLGYRQVIQGWEFGLQQFRAGGKGKLFVPSKLGYGKQGIGDAIPAHADLIYEIELLEIMDRNQYNAYMKKVELRERRQFEAQREKQFTTDKKIIQAYALKNKMRTKRMPSGVSYVLKKKGKGETVKPGDYVEVHYEGKLTDGTVFDTSFGKEPFKFVLGRGKTIEGWEKGLQKFKKGSEGWLLIPSKLAYGPRSIREGKINIPSNSVLIFKIKVVDIKSKGKK